MSMVTKRTIFDACIPVTWHPCLSPFPGWWFLVGVWLIRVRRGNGRRFVASVYDEPHWCNPSLGAGQTIVGQYVTVEEARESALTYLHHRDEPRLCKPSEIDKVRRELRAARQLCPSVSDTVPEGAKA